MDIGMLLLLIGLTAHQFESIVIKEYNIRHGNGGMFFNAMICLFALLYIVVSEFFSKEYSFFFPLEIWIYGIVSGICCAIGFYGIYLAFKFGSFGMTKLLSSFSPILTVAYGIVFLKETTTWLTYVAFVLIVISMFLMRYNKTRDNTQTVNHKNWLICVLMSVVANAVMVVLSKNQQLKFESKCNNEYLILSYSTAVILLLVIGVVYKKENLSATVKNGFIYGLLAGVFNGIVNFFNVVVLMFMPLSVVSPVKTALGTVFGFIVSIVIYKERFSFVQYISVVIGIVAVVLLNIN